MSEPPTPTAAPGLLHRLLCAWLLAGLGAGFMLGLISQAECQATGSSLVPWVAKRAILGACGATACGLASYLFAKPLDRSEAIAIAFLPSFMPVGILINFEGRGHLQLLLTFLVMASLCVFLNRRILLNGRRSRVKTEPSLSAKSP